eukprot:TRINITY_DN4689_c0_g1_i2.p1 TRINITY_DN4689_c0_g1~~TRINITY_DN4689_c0_g1_i2.p1  ORF type:complete len:255 (+),score=64.79 TRINITY_DN4689_c0_g1_i2:114-878(+)
MGLKEAVKLYETANKHWKAKDLEACREPLQQLKIALLELSSQDDKEQLLSRNVLELGAQWSVAVGEFDGFERYMAQLKAYYFDMDSLSESAYKHELLGLYLLYLLTQHRIAEFHTELERFDFDTVTNNAYIRHPVSLEQYMMEGSYNKVFLARESAPAASYAAFLDVLEDAIRFSIADGCAAAYDKLKLSAFVKLLFAKSEMEVDHLLKEHEDDWVVADGYVHFPSKQDKAAVIESDKVLARTLDYARELEDIV